MKRAFWTVAVILLGGVRLAAPGVDSGRVAAAEFPFSLDVPLPGVTGFDDRVPPPHEVIGHGIGEAHTEPHQAVRYFRVVGEMSDRVTVREHGRTYENRPLIHSIVTSPENHARLEALRQANRRLSESPEEITDEALQQMPAAVYQGYSIHGDEASGTEAAVLLLYYLAAGEGPVIDAVLQNTVVILDPLFNPDGRHRFTTWVNQNRGGVPVADPQDREHQQPWPGGRTNHYWFDLNRDWLPARHPESQARLKLFHQWRPQVLTDHHEMGSNAHFFFQPGVPARVNPNTPRDNQTLTAKMADFHAHALDEIGSLYYTRETFDDFFPGKGSTYPDLNGSIGILFEQASSRALKRETDNGLLTYAFTVRNQFVTSLSTLAAVTEMRDTLLGHQRDFYAEAPVIARQNPVTAYLIGLTPHRTRAQILARLLRRHRIRVHRLAKAVTVNGTRFAAGEAFVIPVDQPQTRLLAAMMERRTDFESSIFYDASAWSFPLAFGVPFAEWTKDAPSELIGDEIDHVEIDGGRLLGGEAEYAYLIPWSRYFAPRGLHRLQDAGLRVRVFTTPFSATVDDQSRSFERGTLLVTVRQAQPDDMTPNRVHELVRQLVEKDHLTVFAVDTGLTPEGPDLGSRRFVEVLEPPEIALVTGRGTRAYNAGEVWHLLSERFQTPVSLLDERRVSREGLDRYNTLVLAGGSYGALNAEAVTDWVKGGGRLIALDSAVDWAVEHGLAALETKEFGLDKLLDDVPHDQLQDARRKQQIPGTIFEARLDPTHAIAFGQDESIPLYRSRETFYKPSEQPGANVAVYTDTPLLSGYVSEERLKHVPGSAAIVAVERGEGSVILFMDNPNFRAFWYGSNGLFLNAVFFGGIL